MPDNGPVLSYSVPQNVVINGVSYLELELRPDDWLVPTLDPDNPAPTTPSPTPAALGSSTIRSLTTPAAVSMALPTTVIRELPEHGDPPNRTPHPVVLNCAITNLADGATITGPSSGIAPLITGRAGIVKGVQPVASVEYSVNGAAAVAATAVIPGNWASWSFALPVITTSTVISLTVVARNQARTVAASQTISFTVEITPAPAVTDTTPPVVTLVTPTGAAVADTTGGATVNLSGTGLDPDDSHGPALATFSVSVDGTAIAGVTPDPAGNWSATASLTGLGLHEIVVVGQNNAGLSSTAVGHVSVVSAAPKAPAVQRLLIAERMRLSTFLTAYGVGDPIKTITMLPGEATKLSIQTFKSSQVTATQAESILETTSDTASQDFQNTVDNEQTDKSSNDESKKWHVDASASASWGVAKASIDAGLAGSTNAAREQVAKSLTNAVDKHAATKSSQRTAEAKTSREVTDTTTTTNTTESDISNINQSCTLNVVISQMVKQFTTVLHLVDARIAYVRADEPAVVLNPDGTPAPLIWTYREVTLAQLDGFLETLIVESRIDDVRQSLIDVLSQVFDYAGNQRSMVEERKLVDAAGQTIANGSYLRVPPQTTDLSESSMPGTVTVDGIVLAVTRNTMRTSSLVADVVKGAGSGLDNYNAQLQLLALEEKRLGNAQIQAELDKDTLASGLVGSANTAAATVFGEVFPAPSVVPAGWTVTPSLANHSAGS